MKTPFLPKLCLAIASCLWIPTHSIGDIFQEDIRPFLTAYCVSCHGAEKQKGKIRLDNLPGNFGDRKEAELWSRILESLEFGEMPADNAKKFPTNAESRKVQNWITQSLIAKGREVQDQRDKEGYGNLVPHDLLFTPSEERRTIDAAARLWRITPNALANLIRGTPILSNPFELEKPHGNFRDFKAKYPFNSMMADQVTELALLNAKRETPNAMQGIQQHVEKGGTEDEGYLAQITTRYRNILRRSPTHNESAAILSLARKVDEELGKPRGMQAAFAAIILQPETLFRYEGTGAPTEDGLVPLTHREAATALAFALTDLPPESHLLRNFEDISKPVREILSEEATRLLEDTQRPLAQQRLIQFFREYFDYEKANDVFKDNIPGHKHWAPALVHDLDTLVTKTLEADQAVLKTLLTTNKYYIHIGSHRDQYNPLAYNLSPDWKMTSKPVTFPKSQRMGILTHPGWLVAHSSNFDNDPIHRGLWIRYKLLGGNVPDIPITVDAKLPDDEDMTLRERMHVTRADECYKCHAKMNPLGLPFELYDHYGRFRINELGKPVDTSSRVLNTGVAAVDGDVQNPFQLIERLAGSTHCEQVFVRYVFRFFLGRNETLGDAKTLQAAHQAYVSNKGSMKALVLSLLTSDSFLYRAKSR